MTDQAESMNFASVRQTLLRYVARWDKRLRLTQTTLWLPRGIMLGILIGIVVAVAARVRPWLLPTQVLAVAGLAVLLGALFAVVGVWLYPRTPLAAARFFDRTFGLQERTSTALELAENAIRAPQMFSALQTQDALAQAATVQARQHLAFQWRRRELFAMLGLAVLLGVLLLLGNPQAEIIAQQTALQSAIEQQLERVEAIKRDVLANPELSEAEKEALAQILQDLQEKLSQPNITQPEAVAQLSQAAQQMNQARQQLTPQERAALQAAGQALSQSQPTQGAGQAMQNANPGDAANQLQNLAQRVENNQLTQEQIEGMIQALQQAAQALQQTNPAAAQALQQAAQALQQGNMQQAAQALQQAAQALQNQQNQLAQSPLTQAAQQAAQQLAQSGNQVAQAGQQGQQGQQGSQGAQQGQQGGQQGAQQGQQGAQGAAAGAQGAQQGAQGGGQVPGQQAGAEGAEGAGQGSGGAGNDTVEGTAGSGQPIEANNGRSDGTLAENDFIYAPTFIGGEGGQEINPRSGQPGSDSDPMELGEFSENPTGESRVPIRDVVGRAAAEADQAMETDRVPGALRGFIRQYFTDIQR